jgi:hypothetical protein
MVINWFDNNELEINDLVKYIENYERYNKN